MSNQKFFSKVFNSDNEFFKLADSAKFLPHIGFSSLLLPVIFIIIPAILFDGIFIQLIIGNPQELSSFTREILTTLKIFSSSFSISATLVDETWCTFLMIEL